MLLECVCSVSHNYMNIPVIFAPRGNITACMIYRGMDICKGTAVYMLAHKHIYKITCASNVASNIVCIRIRS